MLFIAVLPLVVFTKTISNTFVFNQDHSWKYITKFASFRGKATWELRAKITNSADPDSEVLQHFKNTIYIDDKWDEALSLSSCEAKEELSKRQKTLKVPLNGEWSDPIFGTLVQNLKTHFWYFTLSDCDILEKTKLKVEVTIYNINESHFSSEDYGLNYIFPIITAIFFCALYKNIVRLIKAFKKTDDLEGHLVMLNIAIGCQFLGLGFEVVHLWIYSYDGKGLIILHMLYQSLETISSAVTTILLIMIASGWTVSYKDFPEIDVYIPVALLVVVVNILIVGLGKITNDAYNKYTDYDGLTGYCIIAMRFLLFAWFFYLATSLYKTATARLKTFLMNFSIISSIYFMSFPCILVISWFFEPASRNKVLIILTNLTQITFFVFLTHLYGESSTFYKISTLSQSVLPGKIQ